MSMSWLSAVLVFALVTSISPGPVNILAMTAGVHATIAQGMRFALGAATGFCLLLLLSGLGLQSIINTFPEILTGLRYSGAAFLLWLSYLLWRAEGHLSSGDTFQPTFLKAALLQWLNPKAWLTSLAVVSLYAPNHGGMLAVMTGVYYVVCFASCSTWVMAGRLMARWLQQPVYLRYFNRTLSVLLLLSLFYLFF